MKILLINDFPLWGNGSGTYLRHLTQELVKLNYKIGIVAPEERRFLDGKIKQYNVKLPQIPVFIGHPELKGAKRYSELSEREITDVYKGFLDTVVEAVANFEPDILQVNHLSLIGWVGRYINALTGIRYIITTHGSDLTNLLTNKRYLPLSADAVRAARTITTVSGDTRRRFLKEFGRGYAKNFQVIPGGVAIDSFPAHVSTRAIDKKYKLTGKKVVLFTGRLSSEKGTRYLINAAKDIKGEVLIVGEGPEKHYLQSLVHAKNLTNVHLLGYLMPEQLRDFYYRADVFVAPSVVEEALGLTILEAMAAKTPVIATRQGGIPLLITHRENGLFVRPRNASQIARACNTILKNEKMQTKMGEYARKTVEEKFTWERTALKHHRLYKRLIRTNGNGKNGNGKNGNGKNGHKSKGDKK